MDRVARLQVVFDRLHYQTDQVATASDQHRYEQVALEIRHVLFSWEIDRFAEDSRGSEYGETVMHIFTKTGLEQHIVSYKE